MPENDKLVAAILTQAMLSTNAGQTAFQATIDESKDKNKTSQEYFAVAVKSYYDEMLDKLQSK